MNLKRIIIITVAAVIAFAATIFLHCFLISEGEYLVAKTIEHDPSLPHISTGEILLHAEAFGHDTCQTVIVLHDGPGFDYRSLLYLKELADEFQVVFYDRRGTGLSPRISIEELTSVTMLIDLLNVKEYYAGDRPVNLVAHGWAGGFAMEVCESYPEQVSKVVILSPQPSSPDTNRGYYYLREVGICWFRSLHVRKPDPQAARDYFYAGKAMYKGPGAEKDTSWLFWRYSALAGKAFSEKTFPEATHYVLPVPIKVFPMDDSEMNIKAIRNYLKK